MRDNFSLQIIETLKKRAAFICSNPDCKKMTIGPSTEADDKVLYFGRAAHICAASKNGPRYDGNMTVDERSAITNAVYLCSNCADMVDDNNGLDFSKDVLIKWKSDHENWVYESLNKNVLQKSSSTTVNIASSVNQTGGITANQVHIGNQPRIIPSASEDLFLKEIRQHSTTLNKVRIRTYFGDAECQNLSSQIKDCFERAGWTITGHSFEIPNKPVRNVMLGVPKTDEKSNTALIIYNWLNTNNFKVTAKLVEDEHGYIIWVGQNV